MSYAFVDPWHAFLPHEPGHVVALAGSGGKTSLMLTLAGVLCDAGTPVILTTTTRTEALADVPEATLAGACAAPETLPQLVYVHGGRRADGKWQGISADQVDEMATWAPHRVVLVETDGAAKYPLKLHRDDEPVWPARTSLAVLVMGVQAVGSFAGDVVHRLGRLTPPGLANVLATTVWEWDHQCELLMGDGGYLAHVPASAPTVLALTGLDEQSDSIGLFGFLGKAMENPRLPLAMLCGLAEGERQIRTACRDGVGNGRGE